jgi:hypothetical protein
MPLTQPRYMHFEDSNDTTVGCFSVACGKAELLQQAPQFQVAHITRQIKAGETHLALTSPQNICAKLR